MVTCGGISFRLCVRTRSPKSKVNAIAQSSRSQDEKCFFSSALDERYEVTLSVTFFGRSKMVDTTSSEGFLVFYGFMG